MRRILLAVALSAAALPAPAQAQSAGGYVVQFFEAQASWAAGRSADGARIFRFVSVTRDEQPAKEPETIVQIGKASCTSGGRGNVFRYSCKTAGQLTFVRASAFHFDAALRSAQVSFDAFGRTNNVQWRGREERPQPNWGLSGGERSLTASAGLRSRASVRGRVSGDRFSTKKSRAYASLRRGFAAGVVYEITTSGPLVAHGRTRGAALRALMDRVSAR